MRRGKADGSDVRRVTGAASLNVALPRLSPDSRSPLYTSFVLDGLGARDFPILSVAAAAGPPALIAGGSEGDW